MHQVPVHCTYITTEAMTSARVLVFYAMYFQAAGYIDEYCSKSIDYRPSSCN